MSIMKKLFSNEENPFQLRYISVVDEWEVLDNSGVVFMGTKENCRLFMQTCQWLKKTSNQMSE